MLAAMFGVFLVQIAARYVFNCPMGWTRRGLPDALAVARVLGRRLLPRRRRTMSRSTFSTCRSSGRRSASSALLAALVIIVGLRHLASCRRSTTSASTRSSAAPRCGIRLRLRVFSIYLLFMLAIMARYGQVLLGFCRQAGVEGTIRPTSATTRAASHERCLSHRACWCWPCMAGDRRAHRASPMIVVRRRLSAARRARIVALASEQFIQGVYDSFVLLAVPLFIAAANIMNVGVDQRPAARFLQGRWSAASRAAWRRSTSSSA